MLRGRQQKYFDKRLGKEKSYRHLVDGGWDSISHASNLNIDYDWWEKGRKSVVGCKVKRSKVVDEYLKLVGFAYKLSEGQLRILKAIYDNRKWWGVIEMSDEFEVEMCGVVKLGRSLMRELIRSLAVYKGVLRRIRVGNNSGKTKYITCWDVLASPMDIKNCDFVMMSFKMQVDDSEV